MTKTNHVITILTELDDVVEIREDELASITKAKLKKLGISRKELCRVFGETQDGRWWEVIKGRCDRNRGGPQNRINILHLAIKDGDLEIREDELESITNAALRKIRISRKELHRLFTEGVRMMQKEMRIVQEPKALDRVRPLAYETRSGKWEVVLCGYSPATYPATRHSMQGRAQ